MPTNSSIRWAVSFAVEGDLRFLGHRDFVRLWERALARADLPMKFTRGYNPHPRVSPALARPVGVASRCEMLVLEFDRPMDDPSWADRLKEHLPPGLTLLGVEPLSTDRSVQVEAATYEMPLEQGEQPAVQARLAELMQMKRWEVRRDRPARKGEAVVDIRHRVSRLEVQGSRLIFQVQIDQTGSARPADMLALLGLHQTVNKHESISLQVHEALARLVRTDLHRRP